MSDVDDLVALLERHSLAHLAPALLEEVAEGGEGRRDGRRTGRQGVHR